MTDRPGYSGGTKTLTTRSIPWHVVTALVRCGDDSEEWKAQGHHVNMSSTSYTRVACGFFETPTGPIWAVQSFQ